MGVIRLDLADDTDKYVLFRDDNYLYLVHEGLVDKMKATSQNSKTVRLYNSDLVIDVNTGKVIKSRFTRLESSP